MNDARCPIALPELAALIKFHLKVCLQKTFVSDFSICILTSKETVFGMLLLVLVYLNVTGMSVFCLKLIFRALVNFGFNNPLSHYLFHG